MLDRQWLLMDEGMMSVRATVLEDELTCVARRA